MKCIDCGYYYYPDVNKHGVPLSKPYCHYPYDDDQAPCDIDEPYYTPDED